jgi:hypothetical protein
MIKVAGLYVPRFRYAYNKWDKFCAHAQCKMPWEEWTVSHGHWVTGLNAPSAIKALIYGHESATKNHCAGEDQQQVTGLKWTAN